MDIIHSKNEFALRSSVKQLKGVVSDKVHFILIKRTRCIHNIDDQISILRIFPCFLNADLLDLIDLL